MPTHGKSAPRLPRVISLLLRGKQNPHQQHCQQTQGVVRPGARNPAHARHRKQKHHIHRSRIQRTLAGTLGTRSLTSSAPISPNRSKLHQHQPDLQNHSKTSIQTVDHTGDAAHKCGVPPLPATPAEIGCSTRTPAARPPKSPVGPPEWVSGLVCRKKDIPKENSRREQRSNVVRHVVVTQTRVGQRSLSRVCNPGLLHIRHSTSPGKSTIHSRTRRCVKYDFHVHVSDSPASKHRACDQVAA